MKNLHTSTIWPVQTPCQIAYRDPLAGYFWLRPYVDLNLRGKIWGIALCGQVFRLVHEQDGDFNSVKDISDAKSRAKIPSTAVLDLANRYLREFNLTIELLQQLGIKAEPWRNGWYWSNEEKDATTGTIMEMAKGRVEHVSKTNCANVRLASNYITKKEDVFGFALAYLRNGHLEISLAWHPELKDCLWGIHVGKGYLCMKLTYEPDKMLLYDAFNYGKSLSTDELQIGLPAKTHVEEVGKQKDAINNALVKLSIYGVKVDIIAMKDLFWLTKTFDRDGFVTYGNRFIRKGEPCLCRLFAKNTGNTPVI